MGSKKCRVCGNGFLAYSSLQKYCSYECKKKAPTKKKPIPKFSNKKLEELKEYRVVRDEYMMNNPVCEFHGCNKEATDIHHKLHIRYGKALTDVDWFMAVCRYHHNFIHENPLQSVKNGYLASAKEKNSYFK